MEPHHASRTGAKELAQEEGADEEEDLLISQLRGRRERVEPA